MHRLTANGQKCRIPSVEFALESYMVSKGLTEAERQLLRQQIQHSCCCYSLDGEYLELPTDKENLRDEILTMDRRFVVDSNSRWKEEASKVENRNKAFIVGETVTDESDDLKGNLFGKKVDASNNNLFHFGMVAEGPRPPYLQIDRHDEFYPLIFDKQRLRMESQPREKRTDAEFFERERDHMQKVEGAKQVILGKLGLAVVLQAELLPLNELRQKVKAQIVELIRSQAPSCVSRYMPAAEIAMLCYAALLLEEDEIGTKTRNEFHDATRRNVLGDTRLIQNALWFNARILSSDGAVTRMAEYIAMPNIKVAGLA